MRTKQLVIGLPIGQWRSRIQDYVALTKPRLLIMVVLSTMMGYYLPGVSSNPMIVLHLIIGTLMIGGGAHALNQWYEKDHDALMRRTKSRPIPAGRVAPEEALWLGNALSVLGFCYLWTQVNLLTALLGAATHLTYLLLYTPLKQKTVANTWVGAVTGALPPLMGWSAATGELQWAALSVCLVLYVWQMPHFFAIAWMYKQEYMKGGFRMLSAIDENGVLTARHMILHTALLVIAGALVYWFDQADLFYLATATLLAVFFLYKSICFAIERTEQNARKVFFASIIYLPAWCVALTLDRIFL